MTTGEIILMGTCAALALCPSRYDPAIRLKEWLQRRIDRRQSPARECRRKGHIWVHSGGRNASCFRDCHCSVPVMVCARCHDIDYGENEEARTTIAACPTAQEVRSCICEGGYDQPGGIAFRCNDCPVHGEPA